MSTPFVLLWAIGLAPALSSEAAPRTEAPERSTSLSKEFAETLPDFVAPEYDLISIDAFGGVRSLPAGFSKRTEWIWSEPTSRKSGRFPALRTWLNAPNDLRQMSEVGPDFKDPHSHSELMRSNGEDKDRGNWYFDSLPGRSVVSLAWDWGPETRHANLVVRFRRRPAHPIWLHPDCKKSGVEALVSNRKSFLESFGKSPDFLAVDCKLDEKTGRAIRITIQSTAGLQVRMRPSAQAERTANDTQASSVDGVQIIDFPRVALGEKNHPTQFPTILEIQTSESIGKPEHLVALSFANPHGSGAHASAKPINWGLGAGASSITYIEKTFAGTTRASTTGSYLTLKANFDWSPGHSAKTKSSEWTRWSLGGSLFGTPVVVTSLQSGSALNSTETTNPPRYYGGNLHLGRRLTAPSSKWNLRSELGAFLWTMTVPSTNYGVRTVAGPALRITLHRSAPRSRRWGGFISLARPGGEMGFNLDQGREISLGAEYQLNLAPSPTTTCYFLNLDFRDTTFSLESSNRTMALSSTTMSISAQF